MQAQPFSSFATAASKASVKPTFWHQHSVSKEFAAETAHSLGFPQIRQRGGLKQETGHATDLSQPMVLAGPTARCNGRGGVAERAKQPANRSAHSLPTAAANG
jgi:hypothetical protein